MARDYNSRRAAARKNQAPQQFLVVVMSFLLGYMTATVMDIKSLSEWVSTQVLSPKDHTETPRPVAQKAHQEQPKPKFEFYTLLSDEDKAKSRIHTPPPAPKQAPVAQTAKTVATTAVKTAEVKVAEGRPLQPIQPKLAGRSYVIQVAAFKWRKDAEQMKGMLILKGYNVSVVSVTNARGNWFRVIVGPYTDKSQATNAQQVLARQERLKGIVNPA